MTNFKDLYKKYKIDFICLIALFFIFCFIAYKKAPYLSLFIVDIGREAFIPDQMLQGKLLYKDLFNIFGPLGYQINCFLFSIFGSKIPTLEFAGLLNSSIILLLYYIIARLFTNTKTSFLYTLLIMFICVFYIDLSSYIFPYTYSLIYAITFVLASIVCFFITLKYQNSQKISYLIYLSYFFAGAAITSKYDYIPYCLVLFVLTFIYIKPSFKKFLLLLTSFLTVPVISYGILFLQGVTLADYIDNWKHANNLANSRYLHYLYKKSSGTMLPIDVNPQTVINFFTGNICFIFLSLAYYFLNKIKNNNKYIIYIYDITYLILGYLITYYIAINAFLIFINYVVYLIFICILISNIKTKDVSFHNNLYLILIIFSICLCAKTLFFINLITYGTFTVPLLILVFIIFLQEYLPNKFSFINENIIKRLMALLMILFTIGAYIYSNRFTIEYKTLIHTEKGDIASSTKIAKTIQNLLIYIDNNIDKNASIFVIPEGVMINYVTGRKMPVPKLYSLVPNHYDAFKTPYILEELSEHKPDYIIILTRPMPEYGVDNVFGKNLQERKIYQWIRDNYTYQKSIDTVMPPNKSVSFIKTKLEFLIYEKK